MSLPTQCSKCGYGILLCSFDTSQDPILGVAACPECGTRERFKLETPPPDYLSKPVGLTTVRVQGRPIPDCCVCPECGSYDAGVVGRCYNEDEANWLDFNCNDCGHEFKMTGAPVREAFDALANAPLPVEPERN